MIMIMITSEGWRGRSRGRERRSVSASLEVAQFWDSYSSHLYHLSLIIIIITDHHYHHWLSVSLWGYHSSVIAAASYCHKMSHYHFIRSHPRIRDTSSEKISGIKNFKESFFLQFPRIKIKSTQLIIFKSKESILLNSIKMLR